MIPYTEVKFSKIFDSVEYVMRINLLEKPQSKLLFVKTIRDMFSLGLKEAKELSEGKWLIYVNDIQTDSIKRQLMGEFKETISHLEFFEYESDMVPETTFISSSPKNYTLFEPKD